ncbi:MAG: S-methyl-5'-thioadenosine phosphorylase [Steroidobacteraceae bacterium]|jgi:5'-methylthioadenosine phosphorylase
MLAVIGGSGVYHIDGLVKTRWVTAQSAFGTPSDQVLLGELDGHALAFLPRHGRGHRISPTEINFRANIDALKRLGVTQIISVSAVGSLKQELPPGMFVIVDQFIDRTFARVKSFFGTGLVAHVSMAQPVCARLGDAIEQAARAQHISYVRGGTYLAMEGPQFSSVAESMLYRSWHCDVIGMSNMPEAKLAREAEICYATVAMVTDYDCWHSEHEAVTVDAVIRTLSANADKARALVKATAPSALQPPATPCPHGCQRALEYALITTPGSRDPELMERLDAVAGRVLRRDS